MSQSWVEKHRPETFKDVQGNNKAIKSIKKWADSWKDGESGKPQLMVGDPGTGKTTTALIVSDYLGYPLNEINTSESRKSEDIRKMARSMQSSPAGKDHQVILLDEVDSWHHASNKKPLYSALKEPKNPILLTANDDYSVPDGIKSKCKTHKFNLQSRSIQAKVKDIAKREGLDLSKTEIKQLGQRNDLRAAINDLQTYSETDSLPGYDERTSETSEFSAVGSLLSGDKREWRQAMSVHSNTFSDPESALLWVDHNLKKEWRGLEAGVGYRYLREADKNLGRAQRDSAYRYWKYASAIIEEVVESRLSKPYEGYISDMFPEWFRMSSAKATGDSGMAKLYQSLKGDREFRFAGSYFEFQVEILPILVSLSPEDRYQMALEYNLDEDSIEVLDIDVDQYKQWSEAEEIEEGRWTPDSNSASQADW